MSFRISDEIRKNDYDLTINKYKKAVKEVIHYRTTSEILSDIENADNEVNKCRQELINLLMKGNSNINSDL